jgi:hypothetical protein
MRVWGERTLETAVMEKVDSRDAGPHFSVEAATGVNRGDDVVRNEERDVSEASEDDDDKSVDSSLHTHYALHPNTSA